MDTGRTVAMGPSRARRLLAFLMLGSVASLALVACSSGGGQGTTTTAASSSAASTGSGCGSTGQGSTTLTSSIDGHVRTAVVHVPTGYSGSTKVALVLNMHGSGATALDQEAFSGMDATSDSDGFIVAYPQGLIADGAGFDWNVPDQPLIGGRAVPAGSPDDVTFLTDLVGVLEHHYCINASQVYATGFSGGARMSSQLACDASNVFAAVAPVSGLRHPTPCPGARPVPVIAFHGTADPVDPYNGNGQAYWTYSVPVAAQDWAQQDGCAATPSTSQLGANVTLTVYGACQGGSVVELNTITGEGHEWPDGPTVPRVLSRALGPQSDAIDANTTIWSFFQAHPLP